jgi:hypothetical protein
MFGHLVHVAVLEALVDRLHGLMNFESLGYRHLLVVDLKGSFDVAQGFSIQAEVASLGTSDLGAEGTIEGFDEGLLVLGTDSLFAQHKGDVQ